MLISFFAGYFEYVFLLLIIVIIHEIGHMIGISLFNYKIDKIIIYPFGGLTKYNALLNSSIYKEIIILLFGPLFQMLFFIVIYILFLNNYVYEYTFHIIYIINFSLLMFNMLPILPLDGGKLINLILDMFTSYNASHIITIVISIITMIFIGIFNFKLFYILLLIILIKSVVKEIITHKTKINKFLVERHIYKLKFKEDKMIDNILKLKRGRTHKINKDGLIYEEEDYLNILFD
jgi:stage IV sporulation protein FB